MHFCPEEAAIIAVAVSGGSTAIALLRHRFRVVCQHLGVVRLVLARALRRVT